MLANYNLNAILSVTNKFTQPLKQFKEQMSSIQKTTQQTTSIINKNVKDSTSDVKNSVNDATSDIRTKIEEIKKSNTNIRSQVAKIASEYRKMGKTTSEAMKLAWQEIERTNKSTKDLISKSKGLDGLIGKFKGLALSMGGFAGFKGIFDSASNIEGYRNTLNVVMKDTELAGKKIKEAKEFANKTPFETDEVVAGMVKLESYGISSSNEVMTAVGDMAGVMGKSFDQAVEAVADAQTGELERLKEFGIKKADIVKYASEKMNNTEIVNAKGQITDQAKFNEALMGLMRERYSGGMDLQAKTAKGVISTTKGMISNIMSIIGGVDDEGNVIAGGLLDTVKNVVTKINDKMTELNNNGTFKKWGEKINYVIGIVKNVVTVIKNKITELNNNGTFERWGKKINHVIGIVKKLGLTFVKYKGIIIPVIAGIASAFGAFKAINTAQKAITGFKKALKGLSILTSPIGIIAIAIGLVVAGFIYAYTHSETFREKVNAVIEVVKEKIQGFVTKFRSCVKIIKEWLEEHQEQVNAVKEFISGFIDLIIEMIGDFITNAGTIIGGIIDVISGIIDIIAGIFEGDWNKVWEGFKEVIDGAIQIATGWWNELVALFKKPIDFVVNIFKKDQSESDTVESEEVGHNAKGTNNWRGGLTWVNEEGGELINLPNGTQIIPHDLSETMVKEHARNVGNGMSINIPKLADTIIVREDADIDKIGEALANKLNIARMRFA